MGGYPANEIRRARRFLTGRLLDAVPRLQEAVAPTDEGSLYGHLRPEELSEIGRTTASVAEVLVRCAREGHGLRGADRDFLRSLGRRRGAWSVPLPAIVASFRRANRSARDVLRTAAADHDEPLLAYDVAIDLTGELNDLVTEAVEEVRAGYSEGGEAGSEEDDGAWVNDLLDGGWGAEEIAERSRSHGLALAEVCLLGLAVPLTPRDAALVRERTCVLGRGERLAVGRLATAPRPHVPFLVPCEAGSTEVPAFVGDRVTAQSLVVLVEAVVVEELPARYRWLRGQVDLARAESRWPRVTTPDDLRVGRAAAAIGLSTVFDFLRETIGAVLVRPDADKLVDAVHAALCAPGGLRTVTDIPFSTVRNRKEAFEALTGLSLRRDRTTVDLAVRLFRLHRADLPRVGRPEWSRDSATSLVGASS
jgi:hypothetical protein